MPRMKLTIQSSDLADMVSVCSLAISARPLRPINECVYLSARQSEGIPMITVLAKDSGIGIQKVSDRAVVMEDGEALIPAKTLLNFLKLMDGEVTLAVDDHNQATLKSKGKKVNITCMDGAEFEPGLTEIPNPRLVTMNGDDYAALVNGVSHCVSVDQGRLVLTGVSLAFDGSKQENGAESCGLDGFRMAIVRRPAETNDSFSAIVPGASAKLVEKVIKGAEGVSFRFGGGIMIAEAYDTAIEVSLLAGEYMDYKALAAKQKASMRCKVNVRALLNAVKMAMVSAIEGKKYLVVITPTDDETLQVSAMADKSASVVNVPCMTEGSLTNGASDISFNGAYLADALAVQQQYGDEMILECSSGVAPMVMLPAEGNAFYQLVLPVRRT